jgi:hypothetical protein
MARLADTIFDRLPEREVHKFRLTPKLRLRGEHQRRLTPPFRERETSRLRSRAHRLATGRDAYRTLHRRPQKPPCRINALQRVSGETV